MHRRFELGGEHIPLSVAAANVYVEIMGSAAHFKCSAAQGEVLNWAAAAIANVVPVYVLSRDSLAPRPLTPAELLGAEFSRAATRITTTDGTEYSLASVTRKDVHEAVALLKMVGLRFGVSGQKHPT